MANNIVLDFECPQFVDFAAELDSSGKDDTFFDCKDHQTPEDENTYKSPQNNAVDKKYPTNEEENRLLNRLEASMSFFEKNTPKLKAGSVRGKVLAEKFAVTLSSVAKPIFKPRTVPLPAANLPRSKSVACFTKILGGNPNKIKGFRKRSSSLNDLVHLKKQKYPTTPMCLKRTIFKAKAKVLKTSEELELEEIAKLQKQLIQHLRDNELTFKRLKLKPKPMNTDTKGNKGLNSQMRKLNIAEKKPRRNIQTISAADLKKEVIKSNNIINNQPGGSKVTDKEQRENNVGKSKYPSVSTAIASDVEEKNKTQRIRTAPNKKLGFHSGLVFHDILNKSTAGKSFNFDLKVREKVNSAPVLKMNAPLPNPVVKSKMIDKENVLQNRVFSTTKKTRVQNAKCDIVEEVAKNKKIFDKHVKNKKKGLPLSENLLAKK